MLQSTFQFAGIELDGFYNPETDKTYTTISRWCDALNVGRQSGKNWALRHVAPGDTVDVRVGQFNKAAKAYPPEAIAAFLTYRAGLGDPKATALLQATFQADLERSCMESNGIQVTAAQHEQTRAEAFWALMVRDVINNDEATNVEPWMTYYPKASFAWSMSGKLSPEENQIDLAVGELFQVAFDPRSFATDAEIKAKLLACVEAGLTDSQLQQVSARAEKLRQMRREKGLVPVYHYNQFSLT